MQQVLRRRPVCLSHASTVAACLIGLFGIVGSARAAAPVVAGYERLKDAKVDPAEQGDVLLGELNCLACHQAEGQQRVLTKGAPDLSNAGARMTPQFIRAYLADPHGTKPGATMPDIFHASEAQAKEGAVDFLTHYLVSLGGPIAPASEEGNSILVDQGRHLYQTVGCVACHAPEKAGAEMKVPSVPLGPQGLKTTVDALTQFLLDPAKVRPGSRMPSSGLSRGEAGAIAVYLLREQLDNPQTIGAPPARVKGVKYTYYEGGINTAAREKIAKLKPKAEGRMRQFDLKVPNKHNSNYGLMITGAIHIPRDGHYTFSTKSDDGSFLYLDGKALVNNDGTHPAAEKSAAIDLQAGDHPITVTYFQGGGEDELEVYWEGPGVTRQEIPPDALFTVGGRPMVPLKNETFTVDPRKAAMGKQMFAVMGCASCHALPGVTSMRKAKGLAELNVASEVGCLSEHVGKGIPQYDLDADQRAALTAAVKNAASLKQAWNPQQQVTHSLAALNCYACHKRDGIGGPTADRAPFFVMSAEFDMGDEGRLPPQLTHVGDKLLSKAIEQIVFEGKLHVRPVLATRMPMFRKESLPWLVTAVAEADAPPSAPEPPKFSEIAAKDGRQLVGVKGLGCVNCHGVNGVKSLGMPAPDLGTAHDRLRYDWFTKLLHDPSAVNPGTRMPTYWTGNIAFPKLADGTESGQISAIWQYLSLGRSMALPAGLQPIASMELIPTDEPIVHRTMMTGAGNRSILVGFPEQLSVAFDADQVRLVEAWRGRFFDAKGMWEGRGGQHMSPLGTDILPMPPGPSFAILQSQSEEWPKPQPSKGRGKEGPERNLGGKFKGYVLDKEDRPIFHYDLNGVQIHEQPLPLLKPGGAALVRKFDVEAKEAPQNLYFQAAEGKTIQPKGEGVWLVDDKVTVTIKGAGANAAVIREVNGGKQLLLPVNLKDGKAQFEVESSW